jgi:hypothetical protein
MREQLGNSSERQHGVTDLLECSCALGRNTADENTSDLPAP